MFFSLCLDLFSVFVFLCKPTLPFSLNPSKRTDINTRMCSPVQFIYNVFHFSHASSLFSYYFSKFRPNYKLVGCPMFMMGLASTSLLSKEAADLSACFVVSRCEDKFMRGRQPEAVFGTFVFCLLSSICICKPLLR